MTATLLGLMARNDMPVARSATLVANETLERMRSDGKPVLPMGFGEAGLPVHPALLEELSRAGSHNEYGAVAGIPELRQAVAGYWRRRNLPTDPGQIVNGPGSKSLLYAALLTIGGGVALPAPSWVSYAAQAYLVSVPAALVPTPDGEGGVPDPARLAEVVRESRHNGAGIRSVLVTLPDNPTGTLASEATVRRICDVAREYDLIVISDEIYRDVVHDPDTRVFSPAEIVPERTLITTGLSKSLSLGGWRTGVSRLPDGPTGERLHRRLLAVMSEIWSSTAVPVQRAAAFAYSEPEELRKRVADSNRLHGMVARAVAQVFADAGVATAPPKGGFYVYPDFESWREHLSRKYSVFGGAGLSRLLLQDYGVSALAGRDFGDSSSALRLRFATSMIYGDDDRQKEEALSSPDPLTLPPVRSALDRLRAVLADIGP